MSLPIKLLFFTLPIIGVLGILYPLAHLQGETTTDAADYPVHQQITTTTFWVGEDATAENAYISNAPSGWDEHWVEHFGGIDDPDHRNGSYPATFTPKENPFYFALPYTDFDEDGRKADVQQVIPWAKDKGWTARESMCKNQWIRISRDGLVAYAQWEDVGPFQTDDAAYVFGGALPKNRVNQRAGLDVSPAVRDYLGLSGLDKTDWQFVNAADVPDGPWKQIITTSQIYWE